MRSCFGDVAVNNIIDAVRKVTKPKMFLYSEKTSLT